MSLMKRFSIFNFQFSIRVLLAATLLAAAACRPAREQTAASRADIPIGVYGALTGNEAAFGQATVQGVKLAADEINNAGGVLGGDELHALNGGLSERRFVAGQCVK